MVLGGMVSYKGEIAASSALHGVGDNGWLDLGIPFYRNLLR